jgi:hypothetical protein
VGGPRLLKWIGRSLVERAAATIFPGALRTVWQAERGIQKRTTAAIHSNLDRLTEGGDQVCIPAGNRKACVPPETEGSSSNFKDLSCHA